MIKKILTVLSLIFVGFLIGTTIGVTAGGIGGGFIGLCAYNAAAIESSSISPEESKKVARTLAAKALKHDEGMGWLIENTDVEGDDRCAVFVKQIKAEVKAIEAAKK